MHPSTWTGANFKHNTQGNVSCIVAKHKNMPIHDPMEWTLVYIVGCFFGGSGGYEFFPPTRKESDRPRGPKLFYFGAEEAKLNHRSSGNVGQGSHNAQCARCIVVPSQAGLKSRGGWHSKAQALVRVILRRQWCRADRLANILTGGLSAGTMPHSQYTC